MNDVDDFVKIDLFDEIERINDMFHQYKISDELRELLHSHICQCGHIIFSSFLPTDIQKEYNKYIAEKRINEVVNANVKNLTHIINERIIEKLNNKRQ